MASFMSRGSGCIIGTASHTLTGDCCSVGSKTGVRDVRRFILTPRPADGEGGAPLLCICMLVSRYVCMYVGK